MHPQGRSLMAVPPLLALLACAKVPEVRPAPPERLRRGLLAFLEDGRTTREDVLLRLGPPSRQFEGERIFTYGFLSTEAAAWRRVGAEVRGAASLVLVFGADGVLQRHHLVVSE